MALQMEMFTADLQEKLHSDAAHLKTFSDYSAFVKGQYIHIPNAGNSPTIGVDTASFPLTATGRTDNDLTIRTHLYDTGAIRLPAIETQQLAYDKLRSVTSDYFATLAEKVGDLALQSILPSAPKRIAQIGSVVTFADIVALAKQMDKDKVSKNDRFLALPTDMYYELIQDEAVLKALNNGFGYSVVEGLNVVKIGGFSVYERPVVATVASAPAAIAYSKSSVVMSQSTPELWVDEGRGNGSALYMGPVLTAAVWFGSGIKRTDEAGVVALTR